MSATPPTGPPAIRPLERHEAEALLERNHVGRLSFSSHDRPDIEPIHYVYADGWIYGRTSHGTKLESVAEQPWVAFEVDEAKGPFEWESVVVKGAFEIIPRDDSGPLAHVYARAIDLMRQVHPDALTIHDPAPARQILFRIHLDEVTGRVATSV